MGNARWSADQWSGYAASVAAKPQAAVFTSTGMNSELDPSRIAFRESRDSDANPNSTPIILGLDVTGSMGHLAHQLVRSGANTVMTELLDRRPITDPHLAVMGIGDAKCDTAPLQVSQFEADVRIAQQTERIWIEGCGGGNGEESYTLPWLFAATKIKADAIEKRGRKGYLFTVGDDGPPAVVRRQDAKRFLDVDLEADITTQQLLTMVERDWHVFHLMVVKGSTMSNRVSDAWKNVLGSRALPLSDPDALPEVVISTIQTIEGADASTVAKTWSGQKALVVRDAIAGLVPTDNGGTDVVTL